MIDVLALTLKELVRRRFFAGAAIATAVLIGLTGWGFVHLNGIRTAHGHPVTHLEVLRMTAILVILIAYLFSFLLAMAAVFIAAPSLAGDVESGVLLPVLARPLSRSAIVGGKAAALSLAIIAYAIVTGACEFIVVRAATGYLPPHPAIMLAYLAFSAVIMIALALLLSTRVPTIAASIIALVCFIIARMGGIAQSIGSFYQNSTVTHAGTLSQLLLPSDAMWQAALYHLEPASMVATLGSARVWPGPFIVTAPPPPAMVAWAFVWLAALMVIAARSFELRDL